jgi:hypothetical protein
MPLGDALGFGRRERSQDRRSRTNSHLAVVAALDHVIGVVELVVPAVP